MRILERGGADNVFTRIVTREGINCAKARDEWSSFNLSGGVHIVFVPDVLDRLDWYAYSSDHYGTTRQAIFAKRLSPKEVFATQRKKYSSGNELMFRTGIPKEKIAALVVTDAQARADLYRILNEADITELNGRPINDCIFVTQDIADMIALSGSLSEKSKSSKPATL